MAEDYCTPVLITKKMKIVMDIETLGKMDEIPLPPITCVCMLDMDNQNETFLKFYSVSFEDFKVNTETLLNTLDLAECIIGFNIVLFDLEYIQRFFHEKVSLQRLNVWVLKSIDPFLFTKCVFRQTCSLDHLLTLNKKQKKTGSGSNAICLAQDGKWEELLSYCMSDVKLTSSLFDNELGGFYLSDCVLVKWDLKKKSKFPKVAYLCMDGNQKILRCNSFQEIDFPHKSREDVCYEF